MTDLRKHFERVTGECAATPVSREIMDKVAQHLANVVATMKEYGFDAELDDKNTTIVNYGDALLIETRLNITDAGRRLSHPGSDTAYAEFRLRAEKVVRHKGYKILGNAQTEESIEVTMPYYNPSVDSIERIHIGPQGSVQRAAEILIDRYARKLAQQEVKKALKDDIAAQVRQKTQKPGW